MKKFVLTITMCCISTAIFGQNFTLSELIKLNNYKLDDFDTYVTQKGYQYYENDNTDRTDETSYVLYSNGVRKAYISKFHYKTQTKEMVSFQTGDNATYLKMKSDLKNLGFKFISTETYNGATFFNYKKGVIEVALASSVQENPYGYKLTNYEISVSKLN